MTAATYRTRRAQTNFNAMAAGMAASVLVATGTYVVPASDLLEAGDVIKMCKIPKGAVVFDGWLIAQDLDTGTEALDIDLGWSGSYDQNGVADSVVSADEDGFGNFGVWTGDAITDFRPEVATRFPFGNILFAGPKLFASNVDLQLDVNAAANATGTGSISIYALYFMDPNFLATNQP